MNIIFVDYYRIQKYEAKRPVYCFTIEIYCLYHLSFIKTNQNLFQFRTNGCTSTEDRTYHERESLLSATFFMDNLEHNIRKHFISTNFICWLGYVYEI